MGKRSSSRAHTSFISRQDGGNEPAPSLRETDKLRQSILAAPSYEVGDKCVNKENDGIRKESKDDQINFHTQNEGLANFLSISV
jgi:hypothetical protein